jgi:hypothetical protein
MVSAILKCIIFRHSLTVIQACYQFSVRVFLECCLRFATSGPRVCLFRHWQGTCNAKTQYHLLPYYKLDLLPT